MPSMPIGFFMPLPNPTMLGFMSLQSYLMAHYFGMGFQYSKRKISSMSNEEFNKLTPEKFAQMLKTDTDRMMPELSKILSVGTSMTNQLVAETIQVVKIALEQLPSQVAGQFIGQDIPVVTDPKDYFKGDLSGLFPSIPEAYGQTSTPQTQGPININTRGPTLSEFAEIKNGRNERNFISQLPTLNREQLLEVF